MNWIARDDIAAEARRLVEGEPFAPGAVTRRNRFGPFVRDVNGDVAGVVFARRSRRRWQLYLALLERQDGQWHEIDTRPLDGDPHALRTAGASVVVEYCHWTSGKRRTLPWSKEEDRCGFWWGHISEGVDAIRLGYRVHRVPSHGWVLDVRPADRAVFPTPVAVEPA